MNEEELLGWYRTIVLMAVNTLIQDYDFTEEEALEFSKKVANRLDNHMLRIILGGMEMKKDKEEVLSEFN